MTGASPPPRSGPHRRPRRSAPRRIRCRRDHLPNGREKRKPQPGTKLGFEGWSRNRPRVWAGTPSWRGSRVILLGVHAKRVALPSLRAHVWEDLDSTRRRLAPVSRHLSLHRFEDLVICPTSSRANNHAGHGSRCIGTTCRFHSSKATTTTRRTQQTAHAPARTFRSFPESGARAGNLNPQA